MRENDLTISLTAFSYHTEPFRQSYANGLDTYIIRLQTEGACEALIEGEFVPILPGDLLLFCPGERYELRIGEKPEPARASGDYFVMCTGSWVDDWWGRSVRPKKTRIADDGKIHGIWHQLILEKRRLDGGSPPVLLALLQALLISLDRAIEEAPAFPSASALAALKMRHYIEAHAEKQLKLEEIARHAGLSVSRAVHLFKQQIGQSMMQYATNVRLAMAMERMKSSMLTLERIAEETGFGSYTYFHRVFRERYGVSPGAYRSRK